MMSRTKKHIARQISLDMREGDSQNLLAFLNCDECHEMADEAVETFCCRALLCAKCLEKRRNRCPKCESACSHAPSHLARRLIGMQPAQCTACGKVTTRSELADHALVCLQRVRTCPAKDCNFSGLSEDFLDHLVEMHKEAILSHIESLFKQVGRRAARRDSYESDRSDQHDFDMHMHESFIQPSESLSRSRALSRRPIAVTGKNYCGGSLNGPPCNCCNGACGPNNGCNCLSCMRRDMVAFNINQPMTLVNREGAISRISPDNGMFYCGRSVMDHDPATDGRCGPNNGHNCHACHKLDEQILDRYAPIAQEWNMQQLGIPPAVFIASDDEDEILEQIFDTID